MIIEPQEMTFALPLPSGIQAFLTLPFPLVRADYDFMMMILTAMGAGLANDATLFPITEAIAKQQEAYAVTQ